MSCFDLHEQLGEFISAFLDLGLALPHVDSRCIPSPWLMLQNFHQLILSQCFIFLPVCFSNKISIPAAAHAKAHPTSVVICFSPLRVNQSWCCHITRKNTSWAGTCSWRASVVLYPLCTSWKRPRIIVANSSILPLRLATIPIILKLIRNTNFWLICREPNLLNA